jgi:hypothetical protein
MSLTDLVNQIRSAEAAKKKALAGLHTELGYASPGALAQAIVEAAGESLATGARVVGARATGARATAPAQAPRGKRGRRIPPDVKQAIVDALKAGESGNSLTKKFGVSYPVVHAIKAKLGLVKARSAGKRKK